MTSKFLKISLLAVAAGLSQISPVSAQTQENTETFCVPLDAVFFFGNGIRTTASSASFGRDRLKAAMQNVMTPDEWDRASFDIAYNPTSGALADLLESTVQDLNTDVYQFWQFIFDLTFGTSAWEQALLDEIAKVGLGNTDSLSSHMRAYERTIAEGKKVILVSHSQGTFYGNQAYALLSAEDRESFGMVATAEMDSFVAGSNPYFTLSGDRAVIAVAAAKAAINQPGPLPANQFQSTNTWLGHSFEQEYMTGSVRGSIASAAYARFNALTQPDPEFNTGIITVTLTWGSEPDVDLHVYEPDGTHVYYGNMTGANGSLDVDDVTSFGPEHYFVDCENLTAGTYQVGVNYYYGEGPETAIIDIEAGREIRNFSKSLSSSVGSAGNNSPLPVAEIVVTGDAVDGYFFEIQ